MSTSTDSASRRSKNGWSMEEFDFENKTDAPEESELPDE